MDPTTSPNNSQVLNANTPEQEVEENQAQQDDFEQSLQPANYIYHTPENQQATANNHALSASPVNQALNEFFILHVGGGLFGHQQAQNIPLAPLAPLANNFEEEAQIFQTIHPNNFVFQTPVQPQESPHFLKTKFLGF